MRFVFYSNKLTYDTLHEGRESLGNLLKGNKESDHDYIDW